MYILWWWPYPLNLNCIYHLQWLKGREGMICQEHQLLNELESEWRLGVMFVRLWIRQIKLFSDCFTAIMLSSTNKHNNTSAQPCWMEPHCWILCGCSWDSILSAALCSVWVELSPDLTDSTELQPSIQAESTGERQRQRCNLVAMSPNLCRIRMLIQNLNVKVMNDALKYSVSCRWSSIVVFPITVNWP